MNNKILFLGLLGILAVVILYYVISSPASSPTLNTATTTVQNTTQNPTTTPSNNTAPSSAINEVRSPIAVTSPDVTTSEVAASVSGTVNPRGLFTNYWYEYGLTEKLGSKTTVQNIGSGYLAITAPAYITGLTKNTKYFFSLVAENQLGRVTGNQYIFTTNSDNPSPLGSLPTIKTVGANGITRTNATLNGEVTPNKQTTRYWFEYGKTVNLGQISSFTTIDSMNSKTSVNLPLTNLDQGTNYYFRLNAQNQWGTVNGMTLSFKTTGTPDSSKPSVETNSTSNVKPTTATLRGTVNPNGIETTYWFEYSTDSLLGSALLNSTQRTIAGAGKNDVTVEVNIAGLTTKTNYFYRVVAQNSLGTTYGDRVLFKTR